MGKIGFDGLVQHALERDKLNWGEEKIDLEKFQKAREDVLNPNSDFWKKQDKLRRNSCIVFAMNYCKTAEAKEAYLDAMGISKADIVDALEEVLDRAESKRIKEGE